jgi:hypothetical protein
MNNYYLTYTCVNDSGVIYESPRLLFLTEEKANAYLDMVAEDSTILLSGLTITDRSEVLV